MEKVITICDHCEKEIEEGEDRVRLAFQIADNRLVQDWIYIQKDKVRVGLAGAGELEVKWMDGDLRNVSEVELKDLHPDCTLKYQESIFGEWGRVMSGEEEGEIETLGEVD